MARKPIHLQAAGKLTPRDRIWAAIRALNKADSNGRFTLLDVSRTCIARAPADTERKRIDEKTIESYLFCLVAGCYLEAEKPEGRFQEVRYRLLRDVGVHAPRLDKQGKAVEQGQANARLWLGMRRLKRFDYRDLIMAASMPIAVQTAKQYCWMLRRAGYLRVDTASKPGTPERYSLLRDTGPKAPMIQRVRHLYDPNLGQVVWHPEVDS